MSADGKDIFQGLLETAINHYSREAIIGTLDFVAGLSDLDIKEWTSDMSPEQSARVYRVWRAARMNQKEESQMVTIR